MAFNPDSHHRRSIRLQQHDYSRGSYYVTICTKERECLFGIVEGGRMVLSEYGRVVREEWERSRAVRPTITLDAVIVMPNHLHGIVTLAPSGDVGAHSCAPSPSPVRRLERSVGSFVAQFKATTTHRINAMRDMAGMPVWQRNYHERVIRNEGELQRIRRYIADNPRLWPEDEYNPQR